MQVPLLCFTVPEREFGTKAGVWIYSAVWNSDFPEKRILTLLFGALTLSDIVNTALACSQWLRETRRNLSPQSEKDEKENKDAFTPDVLSPFPPPPPRPPLPLLYLLTNEVWIKSREKKTQTQKRNAG